MRFIDLRSDIVIMFIDEMREVMVKVFVGDLIFRDDFIVNKFEELVVVKVGKEDVIFFLSGIFGN